MDPAMLTAFSNFGYPALVSGVLLYIVVNKLEKLAARTEAVEKAIISLNKDLVEHRNEIKEVPERRLN